MLLKCIYNFCEYLGQPEDKVATMLATIGGYNNRDRFEKTSKSKWEKLDTYLKKLNIKYRAETFIYNLANPIRPQIYLRMHKIA